MVEITSITDCCFNEVQKIFSEQNLTVENLLKERLPEIAKRIVNNTIRDRENVSCVTKYASNSPELLLWALGLVCEAWVLEILRQKAKDCHCRNSLHCKPCSEGSKFHRDLFNEAKRSFQEILAKVDIEE